MLSKPSAEDELSILVFAISEIFVLQKRKQLCEFMPHHLLFNSYFSALPPPFNSGIYGTHTHTCKQQKLIIITRHWLCFVISPVVFPSGSKRKKYSKHFWEGKIIKKASHFFFVYFGLQIITRKKIFIFDVWVCTFLLCCYQLHILFIVFFFECVIFSLSFHKKKETWNTTHSGAGKKLSEIGFYDLVR